MRPPNHPDTPNRIRELHSSILLMGYDHPASINKLRGRCAAFETIMGKLAACDFNDPFQCWVWLGQYKRNTRADRAKGQHNVGSPVIYISAPPPRRRYYVRPLIHLATYGRKPESSSMATLCGNPRCICPWHLAYPHIDSESTTRAISRALNQRPA